MKTELARLNAGYIPVSRHSGKSRGAVRLLPGPGRRLRPALQDSPFSYVLILKSLTLWQGFFRCDELDAIQENGVPRDENKNASKMLALPMRDATLPKNYYTARVTDCQGENWGRNLALRREGSG